MSQAGRPLEIKGSTHELSALGGAVLVDGRKLEAGEPLIVESGPDPLRVDGKPLPGRLEAWLENEQIVNIDTSGKIISTRGEVDLNKPFGFASYQSTAAVRNVKIHAVDGPASPKPDF